jgi:gamma-glutamyl:cysteine ligase YbdK (ATP-grasp superfamily)
VSPTRHVRKTHGAALELASRPHPTAAAAAAELAELRTGLGADLAPLGLRAAVAGMHPFALWSDVEVSRGARHQAIYDSMRELARREPTFAVHVHVAVPGAEAAVRALRSLRAHVPLLLALSANSPFWQGRDTGLASARVPVFGAFPRVGIPRAFESYAAEVLDENRFLATRDGIRADFIDPEGERRRPPREMLDDLLAACAPHAAELGCEAELDAVAALSDDPGDERQRTLAGVRQGDPAGPALGMLVRALAADFTAAPRRRVAVA